MKKKEDIIGEDFQGFHLYKMNLREILEQICEHKDGNFLINDNDPVLDIYPRTLEDDGMGYGVNEKFVTEVSIDREKSYCNIFIDQKYRMK